MGRTKVMLCGKGLGTIKIFDKYSCGVCGKEWGGIQFTVKAVRHEYIRNVVGLKRDLLQSLA